MAFTLCWAPSFVRDVKHLDPQDKEIVKLILRAWRVYFATQNNLLEARKVAPRFFFKQLRRPFYETGIEGRWRIVLRREDLAFVALIAGNHDRIRRFLSGS